MIKKGILFLIILLTMSIKTGAQMKNPKNVKQKWKTNIKKRNINLEELTILLKRNQIPPINNTVYISNDAVKDEFFKKEPVIVVKIDQGYYGYPISILMRHEIVNEKIGNLYYSVTYCPLCNTTIVFNREYTFNNKNYIFKFGTSGMLRKSNLVMWDENTETWWQQFNGKGIVGTLKGKTLKRLPMMRISIKDFINNYPNGKILSKKSGYDKISVYSKNPYANYDDIKTEKPRLFFEEVSDRLPAMERTIEVEVNGMRKIYPQSVLENVKVINDKVANKNIVLFYKKGVVSVLDKKDISKSRDIGTVVVFNPKIEEMVLEFVKNGRYFRDKQTGSKWTITGQCISGKLKDKELNVETHSYHFAFVALSFYPDIEIYKK